MSAQAHPSHQHPLIHGLMAEFNSADDLIAAAHQTHDAGYSRVDAFTPYPIEEVSEALGHHRSKLPLIVLIGGILGALGGYSLQFWAESFNITNTPIRGGPNTTFLSATFGQLPESQLNFSRLVQLAMKLYF